MSISLALSNALSGLSAQSKSAEIVSTNVANATNEGFARRDIVLSTRSVGGAGSGVQVDGVVRNVDPIILQERRAADADVGFQSSLTGYFRDLESLIGLPGEPGSLAERINAFDTTLIEAASRPDLSARLQATTDAANSLVQGINQISDGIQDARTKADGDIAKTVTNLNSWLEQVADLNDRIANLNGRGRDVTALEDERQALVDQISEKIPVKEIQRDDDRIALVSTGGALLLDSRAAIFSFTPVAAVTPQATQANGGLSGLQIDGLDVSTSGDRSRIEGGELAALFKIRDELAIQSQAQIDSIAREFVQRFEDPAVDPTLTLGDPGVFTDNGAAFTLADEVGLAGRLSLNTLLDPSVGGELRLWRDGLGAVVAGSSGNSDQINAYRDALVATQVPANPVVTTAARSTSDLASDFLSLAGVAVATAERDQAFATAQQESLTTLELSNGVDTDQELQKLLLIEQAYAANARVVQTVDDLIQFLIRI